MISPLAQTEPLTITSLGAYESRDRINKFRSEFDDRCTTNFGVPAPPETFNRWLFEQLTQNERSSNHPILRYPEVALVSPVVRRELEALLPCRLKSLQKFSIIKIATIVVKEDFTNENN
ncbi:MAG: hypothetical protein EZS28_026473 [Streblomastix strix]|uniref:Uncharacterized protein n=1 Tax=Streblomastix strix TaxID=222440 RepID=A0A5J4V728_9EUKA|nr:MAG: hypothetical protein EZS28_026473 [Streblomastix strix]